MLRVAGLAFAMSFGHLKQFERSPPHPRHEQGSGFSFVLGEDTISVHRIVELKVSTVEEAGVDSCGSFVCCTATEGLAAEESTLTDGAVGEGHSVCVGGSIVDDS